MIIGLNLFIDFTMPIDVNSGFHNPNIIYRNKDSQELDPSQGGTEYKGLGVCKDPCIYETIHHKNMGWRVARGIAVFAVTFFTLGLAYIFSKNVRSLWQAFCTGDEIQKIKVVTPNGLGYLSEPLAKFMTTHKIKLKESEQAFKDFYTNEGKDSEGRTLSQIQGFTLEEKESVHNYIQWLFPLKKPSNYNHNVTLLTDSLIHALKGDPLMKTNMKTSLTQMLIFYGLEWKEENIQPNAFFGKGGDKDRSLVWLIPDNHNHQRLSRMLESLHLLGMSKESNALFACLKKIHKQFSSKITHDTWEFWQENGKKNHSLGTR